MLALTIVVASAEAAGGDESAVPVGARAAVMCRSRAATDGESAIDAGEAWGETLAAWLSLSLALLLRAGRPATGSQPPAAPLAIVGPRSH